MQNKLKEAFLKIKTDIQELKAEVSELKQPIKGGSKEEQEEKIIATSGYFDPIHKGHIEGLELAKKLGDKLVVIVNSDEQAILKKGYVFMPQAERMAIIKALRCVDEVILSIDKDQTQCKTLEHLNPDIFAKGGDRTSKEIPEAKICKELGIKIIDGLGKKIQSSSELVEKHRKFKSKKTKLKK